MITYVLLKNIEKFTLLSFYILILVFFSCLNYLFNLNHLTVNVKPTIILK